MSLNYTYSTTFFIGDDVRSLWIGKVLYANVTNLSFNMVQYRIYCIRNFVPYWSYCTPYSRLLTLNVLPMNREYCLELEKCRCKLISSKEECKREVHFKSIISNIVTNKFKSQHYFSCPINVLSGLSLGAVWYFSKGTGLLWLGIILPGKKGPFKCLGASGPKRIEPSPYSILLYSYKCSNVACNRRKIIVMVTRIFKMNA